MQIQLAPVWFRRLMAVLLVWGLCGSPMAWAGKRVAWVIGNSDYNVENGWLPNAARDAEAVAKQLQALHFDEVKLLSDKVKTKKNMELELHAFFQAIEGAEMGVLFYSGHGVQADDGDNYLMPTEELIRQAFEVPHKGVSVRYVVDGMKAAKPQLGIVILDACRNNPYPTQHKGRKRGLGRVDVPSDMIVAYATKPNETADDGDGQHSPYTEALLKHWQANPHLKVTEFFNAVGLTVEQQTKHPETGKAQTPQLGEMSPLHQEFCFGECLHRQPAPVDPFQPLQEPRSFESSTWIGLIAALSVLLFAALAYRYQRQGVWLRANPHQRADTVQDPPQAPNATAGADVYLVDYLPASVAQQGGAYVVHHEGKAHDLAIPAGYQAGSLIKLRGKGAMGQHGGQPGDLYVRFHVQATVPEMPEKQALPGESDSDAAQLPALAVKRNALRQTLTADDLCLTVWNKKTGQADLETLISQGMLLPTVFKRVFYTNRADQTRIMLEFVKRQAAQGSKTSLGHFAFGPIQNPRRNAPLEICVSISSEGQVAVSAKDPQTGQEIQCQLQ